MARKKKRATPGAGQPPSVESVKQRIKRLKKAGYTDAPIPRGASRKSKRGLREKAKKAAVKLIAKQEGISQKEARKRYKKAIVEVIYERPARKAYNRFFQVSPGKFLEYEKGKPAKVEYTFGPVRSSAYVQRIMSLRKYWNTVHLISETWDIPLAEAREYYKRTKKQFGSKQGQEVIYIDLGLYEESYDRR